MQFTVNHNLLTQSRAVLSRFKRLFWLVGGAGSGKTTICQALSARFAMPVYDMDAHIYGAYHGRFTPERHPVNTAWATSPNGLAWLLALSWEEFHAFNQAALPEDLDLLAEDLLAADPNTSLLIDGGICNPALIAQVIAPQQMVGLAIPAQTSADIWQATEEHRAMKDFIYQLPNPDEAWRKFLEFDGRITHTIRRECQENNIPVYWRSDTDSVDEFATKVAQTLGIL